MKTESLTDKLKGKKLSLVQVEGGYKLTEITNIAKKIVFIPEDDLHYHTTPRGVVHAAFVHDEYTYELVFCTNSYIGDYWKLERISSTWAQY